MTKIYVGLTGLHITLNTGIPIGGASTTEFVVVTPNGLPLVWAATPVDEEDTTRLEYYTADGDLGEVGKYRIQAHVVRGGLDVHGEVFALTITDMGH